MPMAFPNVGNIIFHVLDRKNSFEIRRKILNVSYADWCKKGFSKVTLHYMKKNAESEKPFTLNKHINERLIHWDIKGKATNDFGVKP
jgi:hypothetical protein